MNTSELALKMLEWERQRHALDLLEVEITTAVMALQKSQRVGNVQATFNAGRRTYDYHVVGQAAPAEVIARHTAPVTDWRAVCEEQGLEKEQIPCVKAPPSVSIKLAEAMRAP